MSHETIGSFVDFAQCMTDVSGDIIRPSYQHPKTVVAKSDASPVTGIDRAVESALRTMIEADYPDHGVNDYGYGTPGTK